MNLRLIQSTIWLTLLDFCLVYADKSNIDGPNLLELYYTVNNDLDGDFIVSQLIPELYNRTDDELQFLVWPYGGVEIISDEEGILYCHAKETICQTSLIHVSVLQKMLLVN